MNKIYLLISLFIISISNLIAQPANYYNGTGGLDGTALKNALHNIIDGHTQFQYGTVKQILKLTDEDPSNPDNIILLYTGWSIPKSDFASNMDSLNFWNREHVWAKSHGDFGTDPGPGTDAHAIRPVDASVNSARSYKDFDEGGSEVYDNGLPTGCFSDNDSWEPRDEVKGDVARMIFYMATRYEGTNGELDLEVVDYVNTFPAPEHGKLSTLLQWNLQDPPDEIEKNRNDMVFNWQHNRNPFVDYPEFAEYIWNNVSANPIIFNSVVLDPAQPIVNDPVEITANIIQNAGGTINTATLYWGLAWGDLSNSITMSNSGSNYIAQIPGQAALTPVYYKIVASDGSEEETFFGSYIVGNEPFSGTLTSIYSIQGQAAASPLVGQQISTSGIVTGAFGSNFFIQDGAGAWNGVYVYNSGYFPQVGDSVIVTAEVDEYYDLTELKNVSAFYLISSYNALPEPVVVATGDMQDEQYEGSIVRLNNATCVRDTAYGMWIVNDGSGDALIHNSSIYSFNYIIGNVYTITGPLNFDFGEFKVELRSEDDVMAGIDSEAPSIINIQAATQTIVNVDFSEDLEATTAEDISNYNINNGVTITNASLHTFDKARLILTVSGMVEGSYTLSVDNVEDLAGNAIDNIQADFTYPYNGINENENLSFNIYPNPAHNNFVVKLDEEMQNNILIQIFDIAGRMIESKNINLVPADKLIPFSVNAKGVYIVKIQSKNSNMSAKLIIK